MMSTSVSLFQTRTFQRVVLGIQVVMGGWLGWSGATWASHASRKLAYFGGSGGMRWLPGLLVGLAIFLAILVHEAGHWLGSRQAGLRCFAVSVLWLHLERRGDRWHFRVGQRRAGSLGHVLALPFEFHDLSRRMAVFIAAGPAASVLAGGLALVLGYGLRARFALEAGASAGAYAAVEGLLVFGAVSTWLGIINLLPYTTRQGTVTDGQHLLRLRQTGPEADRQQVLLRVLSASYQGVRPRDWEAALVAQLCATPEESAHYGSANLYAYAHYLDATAIVLARTHLARAYQARQAAGPGLERHICCEQAYMALVHDERPDEVPNWLAAAGRIKKFTKEEPFSQAMASCSAGYWEQARRQLQRARQELEKSSSRGGCEQGHDRIQALLAVVEQGLNATRPLPAKVG